ncbi:unnamed protein product [Symbiodinium sp. CCMP2592]|nr:unnamed protein product [Symbiodinium sp. CCMP2592]
MAAIDYAHWQHILGDSSEGEDEESEEEVFQNPPAARSPRRDIVRGSFAVRNPPKPDNKEERRLLRAEKQELRLYLQRNPCPPKKLIQEWLLQVATTPRTESRPGPNFAYVMKSMEWTYEHLGWLHYRSLLILWTSGTTRTTEAFDAQRKAGIQLYQRGGRECMQFNYYVLHYTMCGRHFIPDPPRSAFGFNSQIEKA